MLDQSKKFADDSVLNNGHRCTPACTAWTEFCRLMVSIIDCNCGEKWQIESHDSEGSYRGNLACGMYNRVIVTWEGRYYYSIQKSLEQIPLARHKSPQVLNSFLYLSAADLSPFLKLRFSRTWKIRA